MIRVLHIISSIDPHAGGPSLALEGLAKAQAAEGLSVTVLSTFKADADNSLANSMRASGVNVELIGPATGRLARHPLLHSAVCSAVAKSDIVHIHALWEEIQHLAAREALARHIPYIIRPCGMLDPWSLRQRRFIKWTYMKLRLQRNLRSASALHFTSEGEKLLADPLNIQRRAIVVPNGIDYPESLMDRNDFGPQPSVAKSSDTAYRGRQAYGIPNDAFVVVHFGRVHPKKGIDLTIRALTKLPDSVAKPHLLVLGPSEGDRTECKLKLLAEALRVDKSVHFAQAEHGPAKYVALRLADVFALPSHQENFGIAVVDAMAAELPVIVSDRVNLSDTVAGARAGRVIALEPIATAPERLAAAIEFYMLHHDERLAAGQRGRRYVKDHFTWPPIAKAWVKHYSEVIAFRDGDLRSADEHEFFTPQSRP